MAINKGTELAGQYAAIRLFVDRALRAGDSLFTPGVTVWAKETVADLYKRFVLNPDQSDAAFDVKLHGQLAEAPDSTIQLAAEVMFVHLLPGDSTGGEHKRHLINTILSWTRKPVEIPGDLSRALDRGLAGEGIAFKVHRPHLLRYMLEFMRRWWDLPADARSQALTDPWAFKALAMSFKVSKAQSQAELLLHLVHPDTFEHIMSGKQKRLIAGGFRQLVSDPAQDIDRQLLEIRTVLTEREGREISFYDQKFRQQWQPDLDPWAQFVKYAGAFYRAPRFDEREREYKLRLAEKVWPLIQALTDRSDETLVELHRLLRSRDQNIVRWQDFEPFVKWYGEQPAAGSQAMDAIRDTARSPRERVALFLEAVPKEIVRGPGNRTTLASLFLSASDPVKLIVFRTKPFKWAYERTGFAQAEGSDEASRYKRALDFCDRLLSECAQRGVALRDRLDAQGVVWFMAKHEGGPPEGMEPALWEEFVQYRGGAMVVSPTDEDDEEDEGANPPPRPGPDPLDTDPLADLLLRRKNVVLYGPPGTGKTHASLALAGKWVGRYGDESVFQVTFHPTFAYEDFVEGFRPNQDGRFELRPGIFRKVAAAALSQPDRKFLLVIDELNRGDVARIFGELITLVEADKRRPDANRLLPYSGERFWVPGNLHILGTMNTADRSISLLDIAIRRRFCFKEIAPDPLVIRDSTAHHREVDAVSLADLMQALNARLLDAGVDRDRAIGHSHFLVPVTESHPLSVLGERFRYDLVPLVEEYCYANRAALRQVFGALVNDDGTLDDDVLADPASFARALGGIVADLERSTAERVSQD